MIINNSTKCKPETRERQFTIMEIVSNAHNIANETIVFAIADLHHLNLTNDIAFDKHCILFGLGKLNEIIFLKENTVLNKATCLPENGFSKGCANNIQNSSHLILIFSARNIASFLLRRSKYLINKYEGAHEPTSPIQNKMIREFVMQVYNWIADGAKLSPALLDHKLEELLLIIADNYSTNYLNNYMNTSSSILKISQVVEEKLLENLTIKELALESHKSISSFKRNFEKIYGITPGKYFRDKKMELAAENVAKGKKASEIYMEYGYESTSNFISAFKKKYHCTTKEFRKRYTLN